MFQPKPKPKPEPEPEPEPSPGGGVGNRLPAGIYKVNPMGNNFFTPILALEGHTMTYEEFLAAKVPFHHEEDKEAGELDVHPLLKPHQADVVRWAVRRGRAALFESFGLGKTMQQLEILRLCLAQQGGGRALIVAPLGVRQEFKRDARMLGLNITFIRNIAEASEPGLYITNYETIRDGKLDPRLFDATSLDEAAVLRGFGATKIFREFMRLFDGVKYKFVATATPSPNEFIELLAYSAYLEVMDVSGAKTRFFKRDSTKADKLTIHPHKEREFWMWVASWGIFLQKPSDLGHDDTGYDLPPMRVIYHEVAVDHTDSHHDNWGQYQVFREALGGVTDAAREKRETLNARIDKCLEILNKGEPDDHWVIWHDLEIERKAIEKTVPDSVSIYGSQDLDKREQAIIDFSDGRIRILAAKPVIAGSGCNFQRHCHKAIFLGIGFKFAEFIQAIHRIYRFLQTGNVEIHIIHAESERQVLRILQDKWTKHNYTVAKMSDIIKEYGLSEAAMHDAMRRTMGATRVEVSGRNWQAINNDCVIETSQMPENSVGLILTSIPFSTQYEYSPSYHDFGHTDDNEHFFQQMDYLTPNLLRILQPGRMAAIHVKDRIVPGGMTGLGFQTVYPFHCRCIEHYTRHGFSYMGMVTIVTDVVRENNQTYRLGWSEQCKDATKMGVGMPEYLLLFRKPPTSNENSYSDNPVKKSKPNCRDKDGEEIAFNLYKPIIPGTGYSRARWQLDAHGFYRSGGNRLLQPEEIKDLPHDAIFKLFREFSLCSIYDFEHHVKLGEALEGEMRLPTSFMLLQPQSTSPLVWTDITRMLTLNSNQYSKGQQMHLCLARGSRVLTQERGYVPIEDVEVGEHALTHKGRWRRVINKKMTGVQPVVTVKANGVMGLTLTPDHKLWTRKSEWVRQRDGAECAEPQWIEAKDTLGGYLNMKLPEPNLNCGDDNELWWIVGRWLADGHIDARGGAVVSIGKHKWQEFCECAGRFGGNNPHEGTAYQVVLKDPDRSLRKILQYCGIGASNKCFPPAAFELPYELAKSLIEGYLSGDGHYLENRGRWMATTVSRDLALGICFLAHKVFDSIASVFEGRGPREHVIDGRLVTAKQEYGISFDISHDHRRKKPFIMNDGAWKRVRSIEDAGMAETWCLKVDEDESFTAENCIVKNCPMQIDLADRVISRLSMPGETVLDPFAGLMTVPSRAVMHARHGIGIELSPSYFCDGVAYCKAAEQEMATPSLFDILEDDAA